MTTNFVLGVAILVAAVAVAVGVMLFVRTRAPEGSFFSDGDRASGVFGVLATGFAIFAGFVIFLAFTTYDQSRAGAEAEALLVVQQFETAQFLAPETRDRLSGEIICYGRSVVDREWPEMQEGDLDEAINPWGIALFRTRSPTHEGTAGKYLGDHEIRQIEGEKPLVPLDCGLGVVKLQCGPSLMDLCCWSSQSADRVFAPCDTGLG